MKLNAVFMNKEGECYQVKMLAIPSVGDIVPVFENMHLPRVSKVVWFPINIYPQLEKELGYIPDVVVCVD